MRYQNRYLKKYNVFISSSYRHDQFLVPCLSFRQSTLFLSLIPAQLRRKGGIASSAIPLQQSQLINLKSVIPSIRRSVKQGLSRCSFFSSPYKYPSLYTGTDVYKNDGRFLQSHHLWILPVFWSSSRYK